MIDQSESALMDQSETGQVRNFPALMDQSEDLGRRFAANRWESQFYDQFINMQSNKTPGFDGSKSL